MSLPSLDVLILHWNSPGYLKDCLRSLEKSQRDRFSLKHVWVVDNASSDRNFGNLHDYRLPICFIENSRNLGFAKANNAIGLKAKSKYLILMNPDVTVEVDTLDRLVTFMEAPENQSVGIVGPSMHLGSGELVRECAEFPNTTTLISDFLGLSRLFPKVFRTFRLNSWDHEQTREVDHLMGGVCFLRTETFQKLGGFDDRYFLYFVDLDFSKRLRNMGLTSVYLREAAVVHKTDEIKEIAGAFRMFHSIKGRFLYVKTHMGFVPLLVVTLLSVFVEPLMRLVRALLTGNRTEVFKVFDTYLLFIQDLNDEDCGTPKI